MSDDEILERGGTQEDINRYAHDVGGACGAAYGDTCDDCVPNQASEDELQRELEHLYKCVVYDPIDDVGRKELWTKEVGIVVKSLIRTEKLKLLAEVRERVIGEDIELPEMLYAHTTDGRLIDNDEVQHRVSISNAIRAEQRDLLTKLEAEL